MAREKNKIPLKNGIFLGASIIGVSYALKALDKFDNSTVLITFSALLFLFSFLSIIQGKKYLGNTTFRDSFSTGFKTTVFAALLVGISTYVFFAFIDPESLNEIIAREEAAIIKATANGDANGMPYSEKKIQESISQMKQFMAPKSLGFKIGFFTIILGAITSLVTTTLSELILMKNAKQ